MVMAIDPRPQWRRLRHPSRSRRHLRTGGPSVHRPDRQLAEPLELVHQFVRVPLEYLKKTIRTNHRLAEREVVAALNRVAEAADRSDSMSRDDALAHLSSRSLVSRLQGLQGLKRKLEEGSRTELLQVQRYRSRLEHLHSVGDADK